MSKDLQHYEVVYCLLVSVSQLGRMLTLMVGVLYRVVHRQKFTTWKPAMIL